MTGSGADPRVQRHRPRLGDGAGEDQQEGDGAQADRRRQLLIEHFLAHHQRRAAEHQGNLARADLREAVDAHRARELPQEQDAEQERRVGEAEQHERLRPHLVRRLLAHVDEQVEHQRDDFPADEEEEQVVGEGGADAARQGEQREGPVAPLVAVPPHVRQRIEAHEQAEHPDERHGEPRQRPRAQRDPHVQPLDGQPRVDVGGHSAVRPLHGEKAAQGEGGQHRQQAHDRGYPSQPAGDHVADQACRSGHQDGVEEHRFIHRDGS